MRVGRGPLLTAFEQALRIVDARRDIRAGELDALLREGGVRAVYQPVVDLTTREVVAYEALARGPEGHALESPAELFAAARAAGRLVELDWACRAAAARGALEAGLPHGVRLLVNVEPEAMGATTWELPAELEDLLQDALRELSIFVEITERAIGQRPARLLAASEAAREAGLGLAVDDVGAFEESLALMPLLRPDLIKLDLALVQERASVRRAAVVNAVLAHAEITGATVLAEGIETEVHLERALAMGATVGQGWLLGRPGPLPDRTPAPERPLPLLARRTFSPGETPFDVCGSALELRRAHTSLLRSISRHLEHQALGLPSPPVVVAAFQDAERFTPATGEVYDRLAEKAALVAALGAGMPEEPVAGVRGAHLAEEDPLLGEWSVCVVGAHFAAALVARELEGDLAAGERAFEYAVTHQRDLVLDAARTLLLRVSQPRATT